MDCAPDSTVLSGVLLCRHLFLHKIFMEKDIVLDWKL